MIYVEDCLLENFLVTLLILLTTSKLLRCEIKQIRLIAACVLGAVFAITYPLLDFNIIEILMFKIGAGIVICLFAFDSVGFVAKYMVFIFITALYGGFTVFLYYAIYGRINIETKIPTYILLIILFVAYYFVNSCVKLVNKKAVINNYVYRVRITEKNVVINDVAFLDSGNTLQDYMCNEPVFIINLNLFKKLYNEISVMDLLVKNYKGLKLPHYVNSTFASGGGKILVFEVDLLEIEVGDKKMSVKNAKLGLCYSKFEKNFNCNMLLNINIFI